MLRALLLLAGFLFLRVEGQQPNNLPSNGVQLYLPYENRIIPDYSMIYASQFYNVDENNDAGNVNDALWCQSANNGTNIGVWYYPNGTEVPLFDGPFGGSSAPCPVYSKRFHGQIALARRDVLSGYEGLYKCIIPDENGVNQTLVVGAYTDTGYNNNDGPDADPTMQFSLLSTSRHQSTVKVSWNPPTIPNGIITVYEIRYRESTSTGPYNITNTTNTYYSIVGLIPNTSYTIGVRAYTSIGPGEWAAETINIAKVGNFTLKYLNATSIQMNWLPIPGASYYTIYYSSEFDDDSMNVSNETNQSVVSGLYSCLIYSFEMSVTIEINGTYYEGPRTELTVSRSTDTMTTVLTTVLVNNGGTITGWIIGVIVLTSLLAVSVIIILVLVVYRKRTNINQK
uniref:Fibronectin type-III domain-containing protein n=1 Tax=Amphimedon queenslandica TaxID=400682 RepID=A0A1X7SZM2_AMPQE